MTRADIAKIIEKRGCTPYFNERTVVSKKGNGVEVAYCYVYVHEGHGKQRKRHALGALDVVSQLSEADLASLIKTKATKNAQVAAQKGKE